MSTAVLLGLASGLPALQPLPMELPSFLYPNRLWLLLVIPVLGFGYLLLIMRRGSSGTKTLMFNPDRAWVRHVAVVLALSSIALLTVAWAVPRQTIQVPRERATVLVVLDVSLSMEATDVPPTRLQASKVSAKEFVASLPPGFNVSVIEFAGNASVAVPPTIDRGQVYAGIDNLQLRESTAIGEGIYTALNALLQVPPDPTDPNTPVPATMVVLSDGESQRGRSPYAAAEAAKKQGVPVNTIAFGTPTGFIIDSRSGRKEPVPVNKEQLAEIASEGGGKGYYAPTVDKLREVYADIRRSAGTEEAYQEVSSRYVGAGLALGLLASLGVVSLGARWP